VTDPVIVIIVPSLDALAVIFGGLFGAA